MLCSPSCFNAVPVAGQHLGIVERMFFWTIDNANDINSSDKNLRNMVIVTIIMMITPTLNIIIMKVLMIMKIMVIKMVLSMET